MNFSKSDRKDKSYSDLPNYGWLEKKLSDEEMEYLWKCIDNRKESLKHKLAGQIHESNIFN